MYYYGALLHTDSPLINGLAGVDLVGRVTAQMILQKQERRVSTRNAGALARGSQAQENQKTCCLKGITGARHALVIGWHWQVRQRGNRSQQEVSYIAGTEQRQAERTDRQP